jgi:hypothetical protein
MKKIVITIHELWKLMKDDLKDDRLLIACISMQELLIKKYETEIISKMDFSF